MGFLKVFTILFMLNLNHLMPANNKNVAIEIEKINSLFVKQGKDMCLLVREDGVQLIHGLEFR